jgi:D-lactate dehydrogenase
MSKIIFYSARPYEIEPFTLLRPSVFEFEFLSESLHEQTASLAAGAEGICLFVNDHVNADVVTKLKSAGVKYILMRCAGYNNLDLKALKAAEIRVARVPAYSPYAVAEHALALTLCLNRKIHRAYNRVKEGNFSLQGLMGFDLNGKTVGLIGLGKIGRITAGIFKGFGCSLLGVDKEEHPEAIAMGIQYTDLGTLLKNADIISLHCPLTPETFHLIQKETIAQMKDGVMIINTSRGGLIDTKAVIQGLKKGKIGALGLDVYEEEDDLFFEDHSDDIMQDEVFARLLTFPNVLVTGHQAFFTKEALHNIVETTLSNADRLHQGKPCDNEVV